MQRTPRQRQQKVACSGVDPLLLRIGREEAKDAGADARVTGVASHDDAGEHRDHPLAGALKQGGHQRNRVEFDQHSRAQPAAGQAELVPQPRVECKRRPRLARHCGTPDEI